MYYFSYIFINILNTNNLLILSFMKKFFTFIFIFISFIQIFASEKNTLEFVGQTVNVSGPITGDWLKEGAVTYDKENATLTLTNAKIETTKRGIRIWDADNFLIKIEGSCELNCINAYGLVIGQGGNATITGNTGTFILGNKQSKAGILLGKNCTLTIKDCSLEVNGLDGVCGYDGMSSEVLSVDNSNFTVQSFGKGYAYGAIYDLALFELKNTKLVSPTDVVCKKGRVEDSEGNKFNGKIVFKAEKSAIDPITFIFDVSHDIFDLQGRKVYRLIPGHVYIKDGVKFINHQ